MDFSDFDIAYFSKRKVEQVLRWWINLVKVLGHSHRWFNMIFILHSLILMELLQAIAYCADLVYHYAQNAVFVFFGSCCWDKNDDLADLKHSVSLLYV